MGKVKKKSPAPDKKPKTNTITNPIPPQSQTHIPVQNVVTPTSNFSTVQMPPNGGVTQIHVTPTHLPSTFPVPSTDRPQIIQNVPAQNFNSSHVQQHSVDLHRQHHPVEPSRHIVNPQMHNPV